jgi:hypothetical protein
MGQADDRDTRERSEGEIWEEVVVHSIKFASIVLSKILVVRSKSSKVDASEGSQPNKLVKSMIEEVSGYAELVAKCDPQGSRQLSS